MPPAPRPKLALCLEYPILAFGGTEVLVAELIRGLHQEFAISLVSADVSLAGTWVESYVERHLFWPQPGSVHEAGEKLAQWLRESGVQLAHFHCGGSFSWSMRQWNASPILRVAQAGIPCLTTNHGFFSPLEGYCAQYRPWWVKAALFPAAWLAKLQVLGALRCEVAVSQYDWRALRRWYRPVRSRFRQIYHSQLPAQAPEERSAPRANTVLCVGTFGARKGQPILAEAFASIAAEFPGWNLIFAGRGGGSNEWRQVKAIVEKHALEKRVTLVEGLTHAEIATLMKTSEVFVLPSVFEGLGLSLQEALYHGCACLSTRSGGPEDLIEDGRNGLLVRKNDPPSMAAALRRLLSDPKLRTRLRNVAPCSILDRQMTAEGMINAYRALYQRMLTP